ncbi:uncharacterized protein LOC116328769 isoform X2 [Oreochromis aureus]|uniref:uncharacterized protein LOC116328769 isoform X2 n=1 Tax=Oreochromis aureus TaxID=47969 RepID=UPI00195369B3|nr:uncharacterized protein LOC116328769 isoform X2 [Oreochromis aureus]XP_039465018.1 uncharacterized protein LOC116328769 isoform X2 [Oreochromis aureus]
MKTAAVTLLFGVCVLLLSALTVSAVSLHAKPDSKQFFSNCGQVSLRCVDDKQTADGWTVKRTTGGVTEDCGLAAGFDLDDSQCNLNLCSPSDGAYFCEASSGQRSDEVNITVSEKGVILEIPALPVITGSDVTLRCRQSNGDTVAAYFFFSGRLLGSRYKEHTISNVQQSNEGLYWCATDLAGPSPKSFLKIRDPITAFRSSVAPPHLETMRSSSSLPSSSHPTSSSSPPPQPPPSSMSVFRLLFHLLVFCPYFITTGLLLSIYLDQISATCSGNRVVLSMEMTHQGGQNEDVAVDVTTEHDFSE